MLAGLREKYAKAISEGKTHQEIAKAGFTKDYDEKWGKGFLKPDAFANVFMSAAARRR
jgi:hypothetical protein